MEDKKNVIELHSSSQLPFIDKKIQKKSYSPKLSHKLRKPYSNNSNQSERIKSQYIKLCKQIKLAYGILNKDTTRNRCSYSKDIGRTQTQGNSPIVDKLIIHQSEKQDAQRSLTKKVLTQPSQFQFVYAKPKKQLFSHIKELEINGLNLKKSIYGHQSKKLGKRIRPMGNFLIQRLQTDYLNVQKIRIEPKNSAQHSSQQTKSQYFSSLRKKNKNKIENGESEQQKTAFQQQIRQKGLFLPDIKSLPIETKLRTQDVSEKEQGKNTYKHGNSNLIGYEPTSCKSVTVRRSKKTSKTIMKSKPFNPGYETYYYRDLLWKVNFSNQLIIQPPVEYEHRLRVYIGKGNNSGLIRGLIKRRIWFAITDRLQDANVVWTQIKILSFFNLQKTMINKELPLEKQIQVTIQQDKISQQGLLTFKQSSAFKNYFISNKAIEQRSDQRFQQRNKYFVSCSNKVDKINVTQRPLQNNNQNLKDKQPNQKCTIKKIIKNVAQIKQQRLQNHLINNYVIGNKKALLKTMTFYYKKLNDFVFNYLPYTFHIEKGLDDQNYFKFLRYYQQRGKQLKANGEQQNIWIVKPGQFSNRGNGIKVCKTLDDIKSLIKVKEKNYDGSNKTYIVQAYIEKPLLYNKRKFDLRHYMMITCVNGILKGYWYKQGYVRTTSSQYSLSTKDGSVHLTNDAVQKLLPQYGKYEKGNKISYDELHNYLNKMYGYKNFNFKQIILPKMKKITRDIIKACSGSIDPQMHSNNFQIFGLDFMIDADFNLWLIQVNTNPCLELSCPLLASIIPKMVQNALQITVDTLFPPPVRYAPKGLHYLKKLQQQNKFDLIFDSRIDGIEKASEQTIDVKLQNQEEQTYEDQGEQWNEDD